MGAVPGKRRGFGLVRYEGGRALPGITVEARDVPAAWRRAERDMRGSSFALYDPDGKLVRVGVAPPPAFGCAPAVTAVALPADGESVITGHEDGALRDYDAASGRLRWQRPLGNSRIDCVIVPTRATWVIACARSGEVWIVQRKTGETILHLADDEARALAIAPDDAMIALAGAIVEVWSLPAGVRTASLDLDVAAAAQSLAAEHHGGDEIEDFDEADMSDVDEGVYAVGFAANGTRIVGARGRNGGELVLWDRESGQRVVTRPGFPIHKLAVTRDGTRAVVGARDDGAIVRVIDLATLETRAVYTTGADGLWDLRLTPDDRFALVHDDETGVYVVDLATGSTHAWLDEYEACAYTVARPRATSKRDSRPTGQDDTHVVALPRWRRGEPGSPLSGDGRRYAALRHRQDEGLVALFDLTKCQPYAALAHSKAVQCVCLNHDGSRALTLDSRGHVYVWAVPDAPDRLQ